MRAQGRIDEYRELMGDSVPASSRSMTSSQMNKDQEEPDKIDEFKDFTNEEFKTPRGQ